MVDVRGDRGAGPAGELDRGIPDRPRSPCHHHGPVEERTGLKPHRAVLGNRQRAVGGHTRDADARAELEVRRSREREGPYGRDDGVLLGGATGWAAVPGEGDPDAIAQADADDSGPDPVDDPGAVVVRDRRLREPSASCTTA